MYKHNIYSLTDENDQKHCFVLYQMLSVRANQAMKQRLLWTHTKSESLFAAALN